jgi:hypothetical protein
MAGQKAAGMQWAALNLGTDPCVKNNPSVWDLRRSQYKSVGIPAGPWMHCHSIADIKFLISVGEQWNAPFIGCNIEDVVTDKLSLQEVGGYLLDFWVNKYQKPVHMPTLPWVQNGQGWQYVDFCYLALEMFPEVPGQEPYLQGWQRCIDHAFEEGAKKVTLLFSTQSPRSVYPNVAHCLYTADNVGVWNEWKDSVPQPIPTGGEVVAAPKLKRPLYGPDHPNGPSKGRDVKDFVKRTLNRLPAQLPVGGDFFPKPPGGFNDTYNAKTVEAVAVVQQYNDITPATGNMGQATLDALWQYADAYSKWVYRLYIPPKPKPLVPALGPLIPGGPSLLNCRLTHQTDGIPHYPAIDAGWIVGLDALAVEDMVVTRASSANVGDACFTKGKSGIEYWYGHLDICPPVGTSLRLGAKVGDIHVHPNGAHVHLGVNAQALTGGKDLQYGYGLDVPTVGEQLRQAA